MFCPYCGGKVAVEAREEEKPVYQSDVRGLLRSGKLVVYRDRVEFVVSSVQKSVFNYSSLLAVKKGLDRINFIMEDGRTESCAVNMKNVPEAYLYIEQTYRPYIAQRKERLLAQGIHYSFLSSSQGLTSGVLDIRKDRVDFRPKTGQIDTIYYAEVRVVRLSMTGLEFSLIDGRIRTFTVDKELRNEVMVFVEQAVAPFIAERKEALLARGIYYSFLSSHSSDSGTLDILADRMEYTSRSGRIEQVSFRDIRAVSLSSGTLEVSLTNGTALSFTVEEGIWDEVLAFVRKGIEPYVLERTAGFDISFGVDERIEINEEKGVFHILRQNGCFISEPYPAGGVTRCEQVERPASGGLGGVISGGKALLNGAQSADDMVGALDVALTFQTEQGMQTENIRFGNFALGMSRTNPKYAQYIGEISRLMDYLGAACPACELIVPIRVETPPPQPVSAPAQPPAIPAGTALPAKAADETAAAETKDPDQFGIIKYIEGVSRFISGCATPMTIAIQGSWGSGPDSILQMLSNGLAGTFGESTVWFNTWQFSQSESGSQLPLVVGNRLIAQLGGASGKDIKGAAIKVAKGIINITSGFISQGSTDGQNITEALFGDSSMDELEKTTAVFTEMVKKRAAESGGKVIFLMGDLDKLAPAKGVELLEAMRPFFACEGCVFVVAADFDTVIRGAKERYGDSFDENRGKSFFNKLFRVSFRVPASGFHIQNYVQDKLEKMDIHPGGEEEVVSYVDLIKYSVGCEPKSMDRLFDSFLLIKSMSDDALYHDRNRRLMLFALLCMQAQFYNVYTFVVRMKDKVTPDFLNSLCGEQAEFLRDAQLSDSEQEEFRDFGRVFAGVINTDRDGGISEEECTVFAEVLEFSSITAQ